jgi:hypothetical protein
MIQEASVSGLLIQLPRCQLLARVVANRPHPELLQRSMGSYCSFAYSASACLKMGMSVSASFQSVRKS